MFVKVGSLVRYRSEDPDMWVAELPTDGDPNRAGVALMTTRV